MGQDGSRKPDSGKRMKDRMMGWARWLLTVLLGALWLVPDDEGVSGHGAGTCTRSLMCFRFATMVNVMMTSSDQELHLLQCTAVQAPI